LLFSATDLVAFQECPHATTLDLVNLETPLTTAEDDEQAKLIQHKGFEHEAKYLAGLNASGLKVVELNDTHDLGASAEATLVAMRDAADVIFQATLWSGRFFGRADFLRKVDRPSALGGHSYEVADTKLARSTKAKFLVQLSCYSDLLEHAQGLPPERMHVLLGNGEEKTFRCADYRHYVAKVRERFVSTVDSNQRSTYPVPCGHCGFCRWRDVCADRWRTDDHLSQVAGISKLQVRRLETAGVRTMKALSLLDADTSVPRLRADTLWKLRSQAALQVSFRETGRRTYELLQNSDSGRGFNRLPPADEHDLFFDIEGDPLEEGGLEYLLGVHYRESGNDRFVAFWAHDRRQERSAFESFVDFVCAWLEQYPAAHVYHYASYEQTALKNLMVRHGTREAAVDQWLREGRLVDLYKVTREAMRTSEDGYSIKNIEKFYMPARAGDVQTAGASIVHYERWKETGEQRLLDQIDAYNRVDLVSTRLLLGWLHLLRGQASVSTSAAVAAEEPDGRGERVREIEARLESYRQRLVSVVPFTEADVKTRELKELVFYLLDFHRREDKPVWWSVFARTEMEEEELLEDTECIAGLELDPDNPPYQDKRSRVYTYRFPEQDFKLKVGQGCRRCDNAAPAGTLVRLDEQERRLALRLGEKNEPLPARLSIGPSGPIDSSTICRALFRVADSVLADDGKFQPVIELLRRSTPRIAGRVPGSPVIPGAQALLSEAVDAVVSLDVSYLVIQGPPGAGKTYTASHLIVELIRRGKRVGVAANSHKVIHNLLRGVEQVAERAGVDFRGIKKSSRGNEETCYDSRNFSSEPNVKDVAASTTIASVVAGTAWLFADEEMEGKLDYLFVDEAGQVSLANVAAMGTSARSIVLLGDQMQLGQPTQAIHPGRSGDSVLDYLLDRHATVPPEQGIFLPLTWRMHPDICRFISEAVYDGRLHSAPRTTAQRVVLDGTEHPALRQTGLSFVPVLHEGCRQRSEAEATTIRDIYLSLLRQSWTNSSGTTTAMTTDDILVVAPYNLQVNLLRSTLPDGARVGTVDKFQGQEAAVVIVSMATSDGESIPRQLDFLFSKNRLNVAISRAMCLSIVVACPALLAVKCNSPEQIALVNLLCWAHEYSNQLQQ
jgi:uncharacterized protein